MKTNETKMKVMISQPMNGISDSEVRRIQKELREKFAKCGIEVVDSFLTEEPDSEIRNPRLFCLGRTIQRFLSDVDAVYFVHGWQNAKGCRVERKICEEYGIMILDDSSFNDLSNLGVFIDRFGDWTARKILSALSGLSTNATTNQHITRIIFGKEKNPSLIYTDLATGEQYDGDTPNI